jgi:hypothetical protein
MAAVEMLGNMIPLERPNSTSLYTGADVMAGSRVPPTEEVVTGGAVRLTKLGSPKISTCSGRDIKAGAKSPSGQ